MSSKFLVPINTGEQLKFPLRCSLILFMLNGKIYRCNIIFAGKDFITVKNLHERKITDDGKVLYVDLKLDNDVTFKRNRVDGYSVVNETQNNQSKTEKTIYLWKRGKNE